MVFVRSTGLLMFKRSVIIFALLSSAALTPVRGDDLSNRVDQMQDQIRQLTGQVEQLNFQLKQLQTQRKQAAADVNAAPAPEIVKRLKPPAPLQDANANTSQGVESIADGSNPNAAPPVAGLATVSAQQVTLAPPAGTLGTAKAAKNGDGGFQGKVIISQGGTAIAEGATPAAGQQIAIAQPASAQQPPAAETPDDLFQHNYQALLQLHYPEAEAGFKEFLVKYPDHGMAGSADFWLGEAFWAEQNYASAAQAYQDSYKRYSKGRRAPDSLLKLGLSLARLGQKEQACTIIGSVDGEYPNAVDVKKRAQAAFKREGCV